VRDEPSRERRRDTCLVAALTKDRGDSGARTNFVVGGTASDAQSGPKASTEGGGSSRARWSGARRSSVEKKLKGGREGSNGLSSCRRRAAQAHGKGKFGGPGSGRQCVASRTSGCWAVTGKEREAEWRLASGPARGRGPIRQRNEERGRENGRWVRLRFN
jgi:hypothetical protein